MLIRTDPKVSDGDCGGLSAVAIWLLEEFQELIVVGERWCAITVHSAETAVPVAFAEP